MKVLGTVVSVNMNADVAKNGGGSYKGAELVYRDANTGKVETKGFHENSLKYNKALNDSLKALSANDTFEMVMEKNERGFWNVESLTKGGGTPTASQQHVNQGGRASGGSNNTYPTKEEREATQGYITRQSSIASAVNLAATLKLKSVEEVLDVAAQFENFVMNKRVVPTTIDEDDLPL